ncbi:hypothetical protein [Actinomadura soli]|nr:hypothetical protein [Actinomadura soli]
MRRPRGVGLLDLLGLLAVIGVAVVPFGAPVRLSATSGTAAVRQTRCRKARRMAGAATLVITLAVCEWSRSTGSS